MTRIREVRVLAVFRAATPPEETMKFTVLVSTIILAAASVVGRAQASSRDSARAATKTDYRYRYRLLGVYDAQTGDPIEGVEVADIASGMKAVTTKTGTVSLLFLPDGGSLVRIRKVGYEAQTLPIAISPADTAPVTITLARAVTLAPTIVKADSTSHLSAHMVTFEEHKKEGQGQFIDESEFRKSEQMNMSNFLRAHLHGIQFIQDTKHGGKVYVASTRTQCSGPVFLHSKCGIEDLCYVTVYQDGVLLWDKPMGFENLPDFDHLNVSGFGAAEYYPGNATLPAGLTSTNAECGTLVLYSRER